MAEAPLEVWLRGPVAGVPPLLQPVAHSLLQVAEEIERITDGLTEEQLWSRPAGLASPGFHLQHMVGVVDRLFTYARGQALSEAQRAALSTEGRPVPGLSAADLVANFQQRVGTAILDLRTFDEARLSEQRLVGRKQLPSTVIGLLFHSAEHVQRHLGQLLVTARVAREG